MTQSQVWSRKTTQKHDTFADAHAARVAWLANHPNTDAGSLSTCDKPQYKIRVKARSADRFDVVIYERKEGGK